MTQKNIEIMDKIVDEMAQGRSLSRALRKVYVKRNVAIPFCDEMFNINISSLNVPTRGYNALMRKHLTTVNDVIEYGQKYPLADIQQFGKASGVRLFEEILDYAWSKMSQDERVEFLIDVVERNEGNVRK